eukprot:7161646-Prymnesium_polylepis.3
MRAGLIPPLNAETSVPMLSSVDMKTFPCIGRRCTVSATMELSASWPCSGTKTGVNGGVEVSTGVISTGASS